MQALRVSKRLEQKWLKIRRLLTDSRRPKTGDDDANRCDYSGIVRP